MKFCRLLASLLVFIFVFALLPVVDLTARAETEYYITVDQTNQIVTIYRTADDVIVRQMLCSTGIKRYTPRGTYYLPKVSAAGEREEWYYFRMWDCYAKFATRIHENILFHSIPYTAPDDSCMDMVALSQLGHTASHGCIRLLPPDAEFIAKNCLTGTRVRIYYSNNTNEYVRTLLYHSSYTIDSGLTYEQFLGQASDPGALGYTSSGQDVVQLQARLRTLGYYTGAVDGHYGASTVIAVKDLQKALGLPQDGVAKLSLQEIVFSSDIPTATKVTLSEGMTGPAVRELQLDLQTLRIYDSDIDGIYDVDVVESVRTFQRVYGVQATGVADSSIQQAVAYEANRVAAAFSNISDYSCVEVSGEIQLILVDSPAGVRVRSGPTSYSNGIGTIPSGTILLWLGMQDGWCHIKQGPNSGYMTSEYLRPMNQTVSWLTYSSNSTSRVYTVGHTDADYQAGAYLPHVTFANYLASGGSLEDVGGIVEYATVDTGDADLRLNLRESPNTSAAIIAELENGTHVEVLLQSAEWTLVISEYGEGYLLNDYLEFWSGPANALSSSDEEVTVAAEEATIYATVQCEGEYAYVYGTDSADTNPIGYLPPETKVKIVVTRDDWSLIDWEGHEGYMHNDTLQFILTDDPVSEEAE